MNSIRNSRVCFSLRLGKLLLNPSSLLGIGLYGDQTDCDKDFRCLFVKARQRWIDDISDLLVSSENRSDANIRNAQLERRQ